MQSIDSLYVEAVSGGNTTVELDLRNGPFAPSCRRSGDFSVRRSRSGSSSAPASLTRCASGPGSRADFALGSGGINLNLDADALPADSDVLLSGVDSALAIGSPAGDWVSGQGGAGTGIPFGEPLNLIGAGGNDELHGGAGSYTFLFGDAGDDELVGGSKYDYIEAGPGNDTITGGGGPDATSYVNASNGVSVDLSVAGPQDTGEGVDTIAGVSGSTSGAGSVPGTGAGPGGAPMLSLSIRGSRCAGCAPPDCA